MKKEVNDLFCESAENIQSGSGLFDGISDLHISYGSEGLALLKSSSKISMARWNQIGMLLLDCGFEGVCGMSEKGKTVSFGSQHITLDLDGLKYTISPQSFFQGHWDLNRTVVSFLRKALQPLKGKRVHRSLCRRGQFFAPYRL